MDMPGAEFGKDVYSIAVFTGEFSDALKDHMRKYREFLESKGPGEGRRNVDLRHVPGLEFVDEFLSSFIFSPLSKSLFPKYGNLTWHQTYSALYDSDETGKVRQREERRACRLPTRITNNLPLLVLLISATNQSGFAY